MPKNVDYQVVTNMTDSIQKTRCSDSHDEQYSRQQHNKTTFLSHWTTFFNRNRINISIIPATTLATLQPQLQGHYLLLMVHKDGKTYLQPSRSVYMTFSFFYKS